MNHVSRPASAASAVSPASPASRAACGSTRRGVVAAAGAAGLATLLAACGGGDDGNGSGKAKNGDEGAGKGGAEEGELAKAADIPEGGGKVFPDRKVVVTQPAKGEFKAFSAVCTHQGCLVKDVSGGTINCPCHGSRFGIADGSVKGGPAQRPLPGEQVTVRDGALHLG
ncbi:Rieske (2Fe-2S) protein [Streptosporangium nondiastaticum]|uniref:Cytochrome bc1 complex Rieske iron-sulfur subunit n=1 Tax=Streptosporangium nondiastaticum TaxID=35764 RepID=A0A9X7JR22_9ACTN|nr:Rieske (2Fe-2S) protein [Streptosporangium nondiastaticum]PSJ28064.1 Rieske (2Fe-2S) protein [Streptosporangium nondiastaticum]